MRYIGFALNLCLLAFVADDVWYLVDNWHDFASTDAARRKSHTRHEHATDT